jgi:hypothetical protein
VLIQCTGLLSLRYSHNGACQELQLVQTWRHSELCVHEERRILGSVVPVPLRHPIAMVTSGGNRTPIESRPGFLPLHALGAPLYATQPRNTGNNRSMQKASAGFRGGTKNTTERLAPPRSPFVLRRQADYRPHSQHSTRNCCDATHSYYANNFASTHMLYSAQTSLFKLVT